MNNGHRSRIGTGLALVLVGALLLLAQIVPGWTEWVQWPMFIIAVGFLLLIIGLLTGVAAMAVPACIVGGIGGLLYYQHSTGDWTSWAYTWTLIPGFVGVGAILAGLLGGQPRKGLREGGPLLMISLIMFTIAAAIVGAAGLGGLGMYWPVLLIVLGVLLLVNLLFRRR